LIIGDEKQDQKTPKKISPMTMAAFVQLLAEADGHSDDLKPKAYETTRV